MEFINKIINGILKAFYAVKKWVLANKKPTIIAVAAVVIIVFTILFFTVIKPKWEYKNKPVGDSGYTQSQIDEIADWWQNDAKVENEGDSQLTQ